MKNLQLYIFALLFFTTCALSAQVRVSKEYLSQAQRGDVEAMHVIASEYQDANMVDSAIYWYTKAAQAGNVFAQSALGQIYDEMEIPDFEKAAYWYEKAAVQGYNWAQYRLGYFYLNGLGVKQNDKLAEKWLKEAAEQGYCYGLPQYYYAVNFVDNPKEKKTWLLKSAKAGYKEALTAIGEGYQSGDIGEDADSAFHYFQMAADKGSANALWDLSECYAFGRGCQQSYWKAMQLLYMSYQKGSTRVDLDKLLHSMSSEYEVNPETQQNELKANASYFWYKDMIYNDNLGSGYKLVQCYTTGVYGVSQNIDEAMSWCEALAKVGLIEAQMQLARMYEKINDIEKAKYWYDQGTRSTEYIKSEKTYDEFLNLKKECQDALVRLSR